MADSEAGARLLARLWFATDRLGLPLHEAWIALEPDQPLAAALRAELAAGAALAPVAARHPEWFTWFEAALIAAGESAGLLGSVLGDLVHERRRTAHRGWLPERLVLALPGRPAAAHRTRLADWFCRRLALLLRYGVPLAEGLDVLARDTTSAALRAELRALCDLVRADRPLPQGLRASVFPQFMVDLLSMRSLVGGPDWVFGRLARLFEVETAGGGDAWTRLLRRLGLLLDCGVPITAALEMLGRDPENGAPGAAARVAARQTAEGRGLTATLSSQGLLDPVSRYVLAAGESGGTLDAAVGRLRFWREENARLAALGATEALGLDLAMERACRTLALLLSASCELSPALDLVRQDATWPPLATRLAAAQRAVRAGQPLSAAAVWPRWLACTLRAAEGSGTLEHVLHDAVGVFAARVERAGGSARAVAQADAMRLLFALVEAGVPLRVGLDAWCDEHRELDEAFAPLRAGAAAGFTLADALAGRFDATAIAMLRNGETGGLLDAALEQLARRLEDELRVTRLFTRVPRLRVGRLGDEWLALRALRRLTLLVRFGTPLLEALAAVANDACDADLAVALRAAGDAVQAGAALAEALEPSGRLPTLVVVALSREVCAVDEAIEGSAALLQAELEAGLEGRAAR